MTSVQRLTPAPDTELTPAEGTVEGTPMEYVTDLYASESNSAHAGNWFCSPGKLRFDDYPFDEVCFITEGKVGITDLDTNKEETFTAGQAFICRKGTNLLWTIYENSRKYYVGLPTE